VIWGEEEDAIKKHFTTRSRTKKDIPTLQSRRCKRKQLDKTAVDEAL